MKSTFPNIALRFDALYFRAENLNTFCKEIVMSGAYEITPLQMFLLFFLMMGPMRLINIFVTNTKELTITQIKTLSLQAVAYAAVVITISGLVGKCILQYWNIPMPIFTLAAGIIFAISAWGVLLGRREKVISKSALPIRGPFVATTMIITPFGISTLILLLCLSQDVFSFIQIFGALLIVLLIDFVTMYFVRNIIHIFTVSALKIPSAVLAVMQAVLAFTLIYEGLLALMRR
jgi:Multiple antibiotic transporter